MQTLTEGDVVEYVDEHGLPHTALVTAVWGAREFDVESDASYHPAPSINLVWVTPDKEKRDQYGHQIERNTSVVYEKNQSAFGRFWRFMK